VGKELVHSVVLRLLGPCQDDVAYQQEHQASTHNRRPAGCTPTKRKGTDCPLKAPGDSHLNHKAPPHAHKYCLETSCRQSHQLVAMDLPVGAPGGHHCCVAVKAADPVTGLRIPQGQPPTHHNPPSGRRYMRVFAAHAGRCTYRSGGAVTVAAQTWPYRCHQAVAGPFHMSPQLTRWV
jgi:hypothetical protein